MALTAIDWAIVIVFFAINLGIGLYYARRTGKNVGEFFLSGRNAPWWLAGTSMVATTFAVDTPLAVTGFVHDNGIAGNWLWWNMAASGCLTVFFFAALWRRSGVLTDVEFIELRYGGKAATALRGVRAVFQGVLVNTIIMGWVNLAMAKILTLTLHVDKVWAVLLCLVLTAIYVTIGGFWSVLVTDLLQFVVKMSMAIVLAVAAVAAVGGLGALRAKLAVVDAARGGGSVLAFFPGSDSAWMPLTTFLVFVGVAWWASSYPGAEPGGGSYIAQRIFASRTEKDSIFATLFFNVAHYALRPWPWILVALCAIVLYPHGVIGTDGKPDAELGYVQTLIDYLPVWLRGLMMAGFLAAYMSTIGTHLNLGASYFTNDLYRRFFRPHDTEAHYVTVSRWMTIACVILAAIVTQFMTSVGDAWKYMLTLTAGVGPVMILRWYWWRISAWSEIAALAASATVGSSLYLLNVFPGDDPNATAKRLLVTVVATSVVWLTVTFTTKPETEETLMRFFQRVRPAGNGWNRIAAQAGGTTSEDRPGVQLADWIAALALVYGTLFGIGKILMGAPAQGVGWLVLAAAALTFILRSVNRAVRPAIAAAAVALTIFAPHPVAADMDKQLTSLKGNVTYERGTGAPKPLTATTSIVLADADIASTGADSSGRITLPDSSRVTMASLTRVQLAFFNQTDIANAKFIVYGGKTRFIVEHPQGAKANYVFQTPSTNIAVRGTEGDIGIDGDNLTLNVYKLGDPNLPVQVTYTKGDKAGQSVFVKAGQQLALHLINGIIKSETTKLTQAAIDQFNELGVPTNMAELQQTVLNKIPVPTVPSIPTKLPF